jgi:glyoxylase-like metal-dependent hydrolase (beta-lactamase superfamily II)
MQTRVIPLKLGICSCYLIRGAAGAVLVDAGVPGREGAFRRALARLGLKPRDVRLIVVTHGHFDHSGSAAAIRRLTGARLAAHVLDADAVEGRRVAHPRAQTPWGRIMLAAMGLLMPRGLGCPPCPVDVPVGDEGLALDEFGIAGRVIHTPGHTAGSLSVVLDSGEALVGCLAHDGPPFRLRPHLPIFAEDPDALLRSWDRVLALGPRTIYPGHGNPFAVETIIRALAARDWPRARRCAAARNGTPD